MGFLGSRGKQNPCPGCRTVEGMRKRPPHPEAQIAALYRQRYRAFVHVALGITGDEHSAVDAVQDGFARALSRLSDYRGDGSLEAWVWPIVLNAARNVSRTQRRVEGSRHFELDCCGSRSFLESTDDQVRSVVAGLPERERLAVFLRYYADLDYQTIARTLGVKVGTVRATIYSAKEKIRVLLEEVPS